MAYWYYKYKTDFNNTIVEKNKNSFILGVNEQQIYIDFEIPSTQPLYFYRVNSNAIVINSEENITQYENSINNVLTYVNDDLFRPYTATTLIDIDGRLLKSTFNTYTGNTGLAYSSNNGISKSSTNNFYLGGTLTGNTVIETSNISQLIVSGFPIKYGENLSSNFSARSLVDMEYVTGLTSGYLTTTIFDNYSANTNSNIETRLLKSTFNTYTGDTGISITGASSLGGISIYESVVNHNLKFKGLVAGSNVTLTPSVTGITINSVNYNVSNGLSIEGNYIKLGGILTGNTDIDLNSKNFTLTGNGSFGLGTNSPTFGSKLDVRGSQYWGTTKKFYLLPDWSGYGELNDGTLLGSYGIGSGSFSFFPSINGGDANAKVQMGYSSNSGVNVYSAVEVANVSNGFSNLLLMKTGGNTGVNTLNPSTSFQLGGTDNTSILSFRELPINGSNYVGFRASDSINSNTIWTLPNVDGVSGSSLTTNGSGILSWQPNLGITGATNGLTVIGKKIKLGGIITGSTTIGLGINSITFTGTTGTLRYGSDLSGSYNVRSLVDKGYVTGLTSTLLLISSFNTYSATTLTNISTRLLTSLFNVYSGATLTNINSRLLTSSFNIYSGTTVPATYLTKSSFNVYSGGTLTNINLRLLTSSFNTYSATTLTNINGKLSTSVFNTYSGATLTNINSRLLTSAFNTYSGTTVPATYLTKSSFNTYTGNTGTPITGATSLGGIGIYTSTLIHSLKFKGLVAGTNITLTPSATGITINSIGGGSGTISGATNGLSISGSKIKLGGQLTGSTQIGLTANNLTFTGTTGTLRYGSDLSASYNVRSLVDKGYVTGITNTLLTISNFNTYSGGTLTNINTRLLTSSFNTYSGNTAILINTKVGSANNGIKKTGTNVYLGGQLTGSTRIGLTANNLIFTGTTGTLRYGGDYSSNYNVRSLVDKGYVTGATWTSLSGTTLLGPNNIVGSTTNIIAYTFNNLGVTQVDGAGLLLQNLTNATVGNQQISPSISWVGQGWKTTSTAASQSVKFVADVLPVQGSTNPTATWRLLSSINGGAGVTEMSVTQTTSGFGATIGGLALSTSNTASRTTLQPPRELQINVNPSGGAAIGVNVQLTTTSAQQGGLVSTSGTWNPSTGSASFTAFSVANTITQTGSASGTVTGFDYNPTATVLGTHLAWRNTSGNMLIGGSTLVSNTRLDARGIGTTTGTTMRLANSSNIPNFAFLDNGKMFYYITPSNDDTLTQLLVRDGATGEIKYKTSNTANNGVRLVGTNIRLGGQLTGSTTIGLTTNNLVFTGTTGTLRYGSDLSGSYNVRSLVDKGYVTGITTSLLLISNFNVYSGATLTNINSRLLTSSFNTYSGTTAPATYLTKSSFNTYSATTLTNINGKLSTSAFNTYSGTTVPATYLTKSLFNIYSGATLTNINSRLLTSAFNTYSGTTVPATYLTKSSFNTYSGVTATRLGIIESNYVTGYTSLGNTSLIGSKLGENLRFKGLIAGTNITLTPSSSGITINASGGGTGGTATYAGNGLTKNGSNTIVLGGQLTGSTTIGLIANNLIFTGTTGTLRYGSDLSASYNVRSLVDKGYVTGITSTIFTLTTVEVDLGSTPRKSGHFLITGLTTTINKPVFVQQANGPYTGKGTLDDETEMDMLLVSGKVLNSTTIKCFWNSKSSIKGNFKFNYKVGS